MTGFAKRIARSKDLHQRVIDLTRDIEDMNMRIDKAIDDQWEAEAVNELTDIRRRLIDKHADLTVELAKSNQ